MSHFTSTLRTFVAAEVNLEKAFTRRDTSLFKIAKATADLIGSGTSANSLAKEAKAFKATLPASQRSLVWMTSDSYIGQLAALGLVLDLEGTLPSEDDVDNSDIVKLFRSQGSTIMSVTLTMIRKVGAPAVREIVEDVNVADTQDDCLAAWTMIAKAYSVKLSEARAKTSHEGENVTDAEVAEVAPVAPATELEKLLAMAAIANGLDAGKFGQAEIEAASALLASITGTVRLASGTSVAAA